MPSIIGLVVGGFAGGLLLLPKSKIIAVIGAVVGALIGYLALGYVGVP